MQTLPLSWVEQIFGRMAIRYGSQWLNLWEGVDIAAVKNDWANELGGFTPEAIKFGIVNLPLDKPPNVAQFKALCARRPESKQLAIHAPLVQQERVEEIVGGIRERIERRQPLQWALDLQERERRGETLSPVQQKAWRVALTKPAADDLKDSKPVDVNVWPPAMREERIEVINRSL